MTFENTLKQLPEDTNLAEFKQIEQLVPYQDLKVVAKECLTQTYTSLYGLFSDFLTVGFYMGNLTLEEIKMFIIGIINKRRDWRLYELGIY